MVSALSLTSCKVVTEEEPVYKYGMAWEKYVTEEGDVYNFPLNLTIEAQEYSDSWYYILTANVFPEWNDSIIEDLLYLGVELFNDKYPDLMTENDKKKFAYMLGVD